MRVSRSRCNNQIWYSYFLIYLLLLWIWPWSVGFNHIPLDMLCDFNSLAASPRVGSHRAISRALKSLNLPKRPKRTRYPWWAIGTRRVVLCSSFLSYIQRKKSRGTRRIVGRKPKTRYSMGCEASISPRCSSRTLTARATRSRVDRIGAVFCSRFACLQALSKFPQKY